MMYVVGKALDYLFGRFIAWVILIHEAFNLTEEEKRIIKRYAGKPNHQLTKEDATIELIKKSIAAMAGVNEVILTTKGEKLQKIVKCFGI